MKIALLLVITLTLIGQVSPVYIQCFENNDCPDLNICKNMQEIDDFSDDDNDVTIILKDEETLEKDLCKP